MILSGPLAPQPISRPQILGWIAEGIGPVRHLARTAHAEHLRRTINEYSQCRVQQRDGWWTNSSVPALRVVREHNVRRGRGLVVNRLARELRTGAWVLDWAGGTGWTASMLLERRPDLTLVSLDISDVLQEWGFSHYRQPIVYLTGDATEPGAFEPETFDAIIGTECVEHFPNLDQALRSARRWLRIDGRLAITTPNPHCWAPEPPAPLQRLASLRNHGNRRAQTGEEIYDRAIPNDALTGALKAAGFARVHGEFTQFGGEWPLKGLCTVFGYAAASVVARFAESMETVAPAPVARRLGFSQIVWAEP